MSIEGQGHFLTLAKGRVHTKFQTRFSHKLLCRSEPNFAWKLSGTRKWKFDNMIVVTWPRWSPRPFMVKTLKRLLLWNRRADIHEIWYVALRSPAHHSLFKWWPLSDLDLFDGKVKFGNFGFSIGKSEKKGIFRKYCSRDLKGSRSRKLEDADN